MQHQGDYMANKEHYTGVEHQILTQLEVIKSNLGHTTSQMDDIHSQMPKMWERLDEHGKDLLVIKTRYKIYSVLTAFVAALLSSIGLKMWGSHGE
jgi:hypothetical protein